jgi:hypothetical protein
MSFAHPVYTPDILARIGGRKQQFAPVFRRC